MLGTYLAKVHGGGNAPGDRLFNPVERLFYRAVGVDPEQEQRWTVYARSVLAFSVVSVVLLYALQRIQGVLPLNPTDVPGVTPATALSKTSSPQAWECVWH